MDIQKTLSDSVSDMLLDRQIVHSDPDIMSGIPVFIGTRVPLQTLNELDRVHDAMWED